MPQILTPKTHQHGAEFAETTHAHAAVARNINIAMGQAGNKLTLNVN